MRVTALVIAAAAVAVATVAYFLFPGAPPVTSDPAPATNTSMAETFPLTSQLISDPVVLPTPGLDYMYSSGTGDRGTPHLPERTFRILGKYLSFRDAMPKLPAWVSPNSGLWAPDVRTVGGTYVLWFSALDVYKPLPTGYLVQCIGVATSASPTGPFVSTAPGPAICQTAEYGDIDPRTLVTPSGQEWIYWKNDGNADDNSMATNIYAQRLAADGHTLVGSPTVLISNDRPWEGHLIEAPDMVDSGKGYLLFFGGNSSRQDDGGIGLARCKGPAGPCTSPYDGPWLGSNVQGSGPGEESIYTQNGVTWMLYTPHGLYYTLALPSVAAARIAFFPSGMPYVADRQGMVPGTTAGLNGQVGLH